MSNMCKYKGKWFRSLLYLAKYADVNYALLRLRLKEGYSIEDAIISCKEGSPKGRKCVYKGKEYGSVTALAKAVNVNASTLRTRLRSGYSIEEAIELEKYEGYRGKKCVYKGKEYKSFASLARSHGLLSETLKARLDRGLTLDEALMLPNAKSKRIEYNGNIYNSVKELSQSIDINYNTLKSRLRMGLSIEEAVKKSVKRGALSIECEYNGKKYSCIKDLAKDLGVNYNKFYARLKRGLSIDEALVEGNHKGKKCNYKGVEYNSRRELARSLGISYDVLYSRLRRGFTLEETVDKILNVGV